MGLGQRGRVGILNLPLRDSDSGYLLLGSPSPILGSEIPDPQQRDGGEGEASLLTPPALRPHPSRSYLRCDPVHLLPGSA